MNIEDLQFQEAIRTAPSRASMWTQILTLANVRTMAEVGVWKGDFAKEVLHGCPLIRRYYMIDAWRHLPEWNKPFNVASEVFEDVYAEAMRQTAFASARVAVLRGTTSEVIDGIPDDSLDVAYLDGDHTLRGITIDLIKILPKVRDGGIIGGDDFTTDPWQHGTNFEPSLVCPFSVYFAEAIDCPIVVMPWDQFVIQKRRPGNFVLTDVTGKHDDTCLRKRLSSAFRS